MTFAQGSKTDLPRIVGFYKALREAHPEAERIYVPQDNGPVHDHPDLLCALEPQQTRWPIRTPAHGPKEPRPPAKEKWGGWGLPIQIAPLPTYASWTHPIEIHKKLWRWGKQEVLHHHPGSEKHDELRERFKGFLDRFAQGSEALLHYIGLSDPKVLYHSAWNHLPRDPGLPY